MGTRKCGLGTKSIFLSNLQNEKRKKKKSEVLLAFCSPWIEVHWRATPDHRVLWGAGFVRECVIEVSRQIAKIGEKPKTVHRKKQEKKKLSL
jgi:hypothetical protein